MLADLQNHLRMRRNSETQNHEATKAQISDLRLFYATNGTNKTFKLICCLLQS